MQIKARRLKHWVLYSFLENFVLSSCEKELFLRVTQSLFPLFAEEAAGLPGVRQ
jgi:hypothetical protein